MKDCMKQNYQLPNGLMIQHLNDYETDFVFNEIFVDQTYLKHGIKIKENAIVFDIGANIGLFSLFIKQKYPTSTIYAFEPSPEVCRILGLNVASFDNSIKVYDFGLSDVKKTSLFYYYPEFSVISGFNVNPVRDAEIIMSGMNHDGINDLKIETLVKERLTTIKAILCHVTTLSEIMQQENIEEIDLIKIDVEGSELAVLNGIKEQDWQKIKQIAMEVHHQNDLNVIHALLRSKSFNVMIEADTRLQNAGIYNLFAIARS